MSHVMTRGFLALLFFVFLPFLAGAEGGSGQCDSQYDSCMSARRSGCEQQWQGCMSKCSVGGGAVGACNKDPECQLHCTEAATSQGGKLSCCEGGPKHQNSCPNKVDGNCAPKKTEGGEGKMPELPKPPPGGGGGGAPPVATSTAGCGKGATSTPSGQPCPPQAGGLGNYFNNIFSNGTTSVADTVQSKLSSAADKLSSFLFGVQPESNTATSTGAQGSGGESAVTVPTGGTQLTPKVIQAQPISGSNNANSPSGQVTGFGVQGAVASEQSGMMKAIGETLSGIGVTLRNLLSSFAF